MTSPMRFRNFSWKFNPHSIKISSKKDIAEEHMPYGDNILQSIGRNCAVITGEGSFFGKDCFEQYRKLWSLYRENKDGILSIPEFMVMKAHFSSLTIIGDPTDNLISYKFTFIEVMNSEREHLVFSIYQAKENESLWDVSYKFNISVEELLRLNPKIRHPFDVTTGDEVRLC